MWKWIVAVIFSLFLLGGCMTTEMADAINTFGQGVADTAQKFEKQGVDYEVRGKIPLEIMFTWSPTGFGMRLPNGYIEAFVASGRGLGFRPEDVGGE